MGWFAAKVRFRAVRAGGRASGELLEDSVFVFRSRSAAAAVRRAAAIAEAMVMERTDVDERGRRIRWAVDRVHDVVPVGTEGLVDGSEVWRDRFTAPRRDSGGAA